MPRISVVITSYNAVGLIAETLRSVLDQTYRDLEIVVVDGGSTDGTIDLVSRYPPPVRLISGTRLSKSAGRNVGIRATEGEYIALVDADDLWRQDKLKRQMDVFAAQPDIGWVYSDCEMFDGQTSANLGLWSDRNRLYAGDILKPLFRNNFVASPTPVFHRSVFEKVGGFDEALARYEPEDADMWLRAAAEFPVGIVREPLARFRRHSESLTMREDPKLALEGILAVLDRAASREPERLGPLRDSVFAQWFVAAGKGHAGQGETPAARAMFARAIRCHPANVSGWLFWAATGIGGPTLHYLHRLNVGRRGY
jgi:glycosyltransferase involved in cell wall biosynthesis